MVSKSFHLLKGVVLLAAQTARSQAYIQALVSHGMHPESVIILGSDPLLQSSNSVHQKDWQGIKLPNLAESIAMTCEQANIPVLRSKENNINAEETALCIKKASPQIIIYSGPGGQIVSDTTLSLCPQFLHFHSGWLPDYRGSTTLYYALLDHEQPAVTALILDRTIDTGPIVARQHYPKPPANIDIDSVYDSAIRADLLIQIMRIYLSTGVLPTLSEQLSAEGETFYVIHPVLKHLAILSLEANR